MVVLTDPIGDLLTRIRNAQHAGHSTCRTQYARILHELCTLLQKEGWIGGVAVEGEEPKRDLVVTFAPEHTTLELKRVSKPGRRVYAGVEDLKPVLRGYGIAVLTTSEGLMTDAEARKRKLGGEVLCTVA